MNYTLSSQMFIIYSISLQAKRLCYHLPPNNPNLYSYVKIILQQNCNILFQYFLHYYCPPSIYILLFHLQSDSGWVRVEKKGRYEHTHSMFHDLLWKFDNLCKLFNDIIKICVGEWNRLTTSKFEGWIDDPCFIRLVVIRPLVRTVMRA